ncbi:MAG: exopolyphosphatase [Desulfobacterales bacterium]|jgi:oligoribonuclease NrnB/cAMP/cGMP phosphodiesterase (DHH superfamily)
MRIVTRADFDGVVCAALLMDAVAVTEPTLWIEPSEMQKGLVPIKTGDIVANLPYHPDCSLWFDHHFSNKPETPVAGRFELAPSAAGLIHRYYGDTFSRDFSELVRQADKIDSADLTEEEVLHPENHPYILLSMTLSGRHLDDEPYWNQIARLLQTSSIDQIMKNPEVAARCEEVIEDNRTYRDLLKTHTTLHGQVAVTDFRGLEKDPSGNRFLVYSLYPESVVQVKIRFDGSDPDRVIVSVGHSIFNRNCRVNVGLLMKRFEGGGHPGAGSCRFHVSKSDAYISAILSTLIQNDPIEA